MLHVHQKLDVALGSLDGRKIQARRGKMVGHGIALGHLQHLTVGGRLTHDAFFSYFLAPGLKLGLDQADAYGIRRGNGISHREDMFERNKRYINAEERHRL